jgi:uncharacterized protein
MSSITEAARDFLSQKRIAVAGVSRHPQGHGANLVYRRLRERGYTAFAVNPNADTVEGDHCYHDLRSIPGGVDAVVIATAPGASASVVRECRELGIGRVWIHRSTGTGSFSEEAADYCRGNGIHAIPGGCPLMYGPTADFTHTCFRWFLGATGQLPAATT